MDSITDCISSFIDGRVRLRHPALKDPSLAEAACSVLSGVEGVESVQANPVTGSLLLFYNPKKLSKEALLELAKEGLALLPKGEHSSKASASSSLLNVMLSRNTTRMVNRSMLISLFLCVASAFIGMGNLHRITGAAFALASLQHMAAHRNALW